MWAKLVKDNHLLRDTVVAYADGDTRTHKVFRALEKVCLEMDLAKPIWLDANVKAFQRHGKTRFRAESFVEDISFDYLEIEILEED